MNLTELNAESITLLIGAAPSDVDLTESRTTKDNATVVSLCGVAVIIILFRFIVKFRSLKPNLKIDDWIIAFALVPLIAILASALVAGNYGMGKHIWLSTIGGMVKMRQILYASLIVYLLELFVIKLSILAFYRRVFGMNYWNWAGVIATTIWAFGSLVAILCCPAPVSYFWNSTISTDGTWRYNFYNYYIGNAAGNVVTDVFILFVPVPTVWGLDVRITQKISISMVLLLGVFVCIASIVRIHYLTFLKDETDITWTISQVYVWSTVEPCVGIICASLPTLKPVIRSAMKAEHLMFFKNTSKTFRRSTSMHDLRNRANASRHSNHSTHSKNIASQSSFEAKPDDYPTNNDKIGLTSTVAHVVRSRRAGKELEEYLGPMFIRVERELEWTIDRTSSFPSEG
ncbi:hypothetical protein N7495_008993 [Penicillium taxi]|uniref:uncharacterized protein n=1 Tax=Penicillium taxi TaxID=168475 RepID=UPI0025457863|nr:uncharacterized protein N7495_008993 [Penicillium taxi]KAJ5888952.1 hypothetical protein N7495_008993 [Penicillium taxi]